MERRMRRAESRVRAVLAMPTRSERAGSSDWQDGYTAGVIAATHAITADGRKAGR
jgi:hypothetical protein